MKTSIFVDDFPLPCLSTRGYIVLENHHVEYINHRSQWAMATQATSLRCWPSKAPSISGSWGCNELHGSIVKLINMELTMLYHISCYIYVYYIYIYHVISIIHIHVISCYIESDLFIDHVISIEAFFWMILILSYHIPHRRSSVRFMGHVY